MTVDSVRVLLRPGHGKVSQADCRETAVTILPAIATIADVDGFASHTAYRASRASGSWYADFFHRRRAEGINAVDIQHTVRENELVLIYAAAIASAPVTPATSATPIYARVIATLLPATTSGRQHKQ
ncbi:MAG: hypothetical protein DMG96_43205 [Acidobacteria bacterium]|nr:MAG: hypothetical protein DMG96_43205 [Acidobacteriota bacterium]